MGNDPINDLGLFCPSGGDFYICQESDIQFVGCCGIDPCKDRTGRCPGDQLFPASFDAGRYFGIGAQTCVEPFEADHPNPWYTCTYDGVGDPFMGCCATNACGQGHCPDGDLIAARLSDDPYDADAFISPDGNSYSNPTDSGGSSLSTGAIVGIAVGGAAFVVILGLLFWWRRRKQQQAAAEGNHVQTIPHPDQLDISQAAPYSPYKGKSASRIATLYYEFLTILLLNRYISELTNDGKFGITTQYWQSDSANLCIRPR